MSELIVRVVGRIPQKDLKSVIAALRQTKDNKTLIDILDSNLDDYAAAQNTKIVSTARDEFFQSSYLERIAVVEKSLALLLKTLKNEVQTKQTKTPEKLKTYFERLTRSYKKKITSNTQLYNIKSYQSLFHDFFSQCISGLQEAGLDKHAANKRLAKAHDYVVDRKSVV